MKPRLPMLLVGLSVLGACASVPAPQTPPTASAADRHRITVATAASRLEVPVAAGASALGAEGRARVHAFAASYLRYGHGALVLSTPNGSGNAASAEAVGADARRVLIEAGVSYAAVAGASYDASGDTDAPVVLSFTRYEAHAPECAPLWQQDLGHQSNNQAWESFGCATQANLAALVEDPADLLYPRGEDPRDSGRRTTVMNAYREGESTHADRSPDERITISNAVQ